LLPTSALTGLSLPQLESLLIHELAHIRRHDYLVNILQSVIETLLFYHPAVWWVSHRIRVEREHCCDDVAVTVMGNPVVYAKALATLETLRSQPQFALAASDGKLLSRIKRVLGKPEQSANWLASVVVIGIVVLAGIITGISEIQAQQPGEIQRELSKAQVTLDDINQLTTSTQKVDAYIALAPNLPNNGSAYVAYLKAVATLPSDLKQQAIKALTKRINSTVGQPDWSKIPDYGSGINIEYAGKSLVVATENAAAIFDFFEPFVEKDSEPLLLHGGVAYRYRILERGASEEQYGEGIVFENYDRDVDSETGNTNVTVAAGGDVSYIRAGSIIFDWSYGTEQDGWIYVDYLKPRLLDKSSFETFDLTPFVTDNKDLGISLSLPPFDIAEVISPFGDAGSNGVTLRTLQMDSHVLAVQAGKILSVEFLGPNDGYLVAIKHPDGFITAYSNLQRNTRVEVGDEVAQGDLLGYVGGGFLLPYDQLKLYVKNSEGSYVDPMQFLNVHYFESVPTALNTTIYASDVGREPHIWATIRGRVKLSNDFTQLERTQTPNSYIHLEERQGTNRKSVIVKKHKDNPIEYLYTVNGQEQPFDDEAEAWYQLIFAQAITQSMQEYEASLTPAEKLTRSSRLMSSYNNYLSLIILESNDAALLNGPTFTDVNGSVTVMNYSPEDALIAIHTAVHYASHDLLAATAEVHDNKIEAFIYDLIKNVDLEPLAFQKLLLLINEMKIKKAKQKMIGELLPLLPDNLMREQYQQFSESVLESARIYEHPYLLFPEQAKALETIDEVVIYLDSNENSRAVPFTFDPAEFGIPETLEQPYDLRVSVEDALGERDVFTKRVDAGQPIETSLQIYGDATIKIFINEILFSAYEQ
jgi:hypothetical protein